MQTEHADGTITVIWYTRATGEVDAQIQDEAGEQSFTVTLASEEEAVKLRAELDDPDGELMYEEDAICAKYEALHCLRP